MAWNNDSTYQNQNTPYYKQNNQGPDDQLSTRCIISELNQITTHFVSHELVIVYECNIY